MAILTIDAPNSTIAGSPDTTVTLTGTGFFPNSVATFNGTPLVTTYIDATHVSCVVPAALLGTPGVFPIQVLSDYESFDYEAQPSTRQAVAVPSPSGLDTLPNVTFSYWIKPLATTAVFADAVVIEKQAVAATYSFELQSTGVDLNSYNRLVGTIIASDLIHSASEVSDFPYLAHNQWAHMAISFLGAASPITNATYEVSVNGALVTTFTNGGTLLGLLNISSAGPGPFTIGCAPDPGGGLVAFQNSIRNGRLSQISVFSRYYNIADVNTYLYNGGEPPDLLGNMAPGLISWWLANGTADDATGLNNANSYNGLTYATDVPGSTHMPSNTIPFTVTTPASTLVDLFPKVDSFRGGREVWVHGVPLLVDTSSDVSFLAQRLPAGWSSTLTGSGRAHSSFDGLTLTTGSLSGSTARVSTDSTTYDSFSASISVTPLEPDQAPASEVDPLVFEFFVDSINYAQIRVRRLLAVDHSMLVVDTLIGLRDEVVTGGGLILKAQDLKLQIVRHSNYVFLLVNGRLIAETNRFRPAAMGLLRATVSNLASPTRVSTRLTAFTVRSHAVIGGRLLEGKVDFSGRRLRGIVPSASLAEVGTKDIIVFGSWGSSILSGAFEYQVPLGKGLGGQVTSPLTSYDDPSVRD